MLKLVEKNWSPKKEKRFSAFSGGIEFGAITRIDARSRPAFFLPPNTYPLLLPFATKTSLLPSTVVLAVSVKMSVCIKSVLPQRVATFVFLTQHQGHKDKDAIYHSDTQSVDPTC